jgi:hypothetical protein
LCSIKILSSSQPHLLSFENTGEAGGRYIKDGALVKYTLHSHHHAHQTGRSIEMALHSLVYKTERALEDGLITLGVFLVIKGVFDNTTFESM